MLKVLFPKMLFFLDVACLKLGKFQHKIENYNN